MNLDPIFTPHSIAVVGASSQEGTVGNDVVKNLVQQGYLGKVFPVNPKIDSLYDIHVFHDLADIQEQIDVMIVAVPAKIVPSVMETAGQKGVSAAVILSAGFKEVGNQELEDQVAEIAKTYDMAVIGPNCLGVINPFWGMNASFAAQMPDKGNIAFVSQSGALCTSALDYAIEFRMGFSKFLSTGNKAVIDEIELLKFLLHDEQTKVIAMYVEELKDAAGFISVARQLTHASPPKPIVVLKSGRTAAGAQAVASHTGALSTEDRIYDALFQQAGIVRAQTVRELFEYADMFARNPLVPVEKIAIVTNAGGPGVLATDEAVKHELGLSRLSDQTIASLKNFLPEVANIHNPVDMLGAATADQYRQTLDILEQDPETDAILSILTPQSMTEIEGTAEVIAQFKQRSQKPIVAAFMGQHSVFDGVLKMEAAQVNTTSFPELAARCLATLGMFVRWTQQPLGEMSQLESIDKNQVEEIFHNQQATSLPPETVTTILQNYGLPTLRSRVVQSAQEARQFAEEIGKQVVLKIVSPDIEHKSDVGGVLVNISANQVENSYDQILQAVQQRVPEAKVDGVLVMEMAEQGVEMIVGAKDIPGLGKMVLVGLGGVYVEVFQDVQMGFTPLTEQYVRQMIGQLQSKKLLDGVRGQPPADVGSLVDVVLRIGQLVTDFPQISELDLNPVRVLEQGKGVQVLDARILL